MSDNADAGERQTTIIELTLVDISQEVSKDETGAQLKEKVESILDEFNCDTAENYLFRKPRNNDVHDRLKQQILKFVKVPDKYMSLLSVLLKSQAFHMTHRLCAETEQNLPVIEIPRTEYNKPYIPTNKNHDGVPVVNIYPLSISHQFPFVGMARCVPEEVSKDVSHLPLVGLDIVAFDKFNPRLYSSASEFIEVFQDYFTPWEWKNITKCGTEDQSLREFYLRWATKEAYTKALGVGLGLPFESFEIRLVDVEGGIFSWLCCQGICKAGKQQGVLLQGSVVINKRNSDPTEEDCIFYFLPLKKRSRMPPETNNFGIEQADGCACVCVLLENGGPKWDLELEVEWRSTEDLVH